MNNDQVKLYHYSPESVLEPHSVEQKNSGSWEKKPSGLWLSDDRDIESSWPRWCQENDFHLEDLEHRFELEVDLSDVLVITTAHGLRNFSTKYGIVEEFSGRESFTPWGDVRSPWKDVRSIIWKDVAENHKGILITPYIWKCRLDLQTSWYYTWDCASSCIWDVSCIKSYINVTSLHVQTGNQSAACGLNQKENT